MGICNIIWDVDPVWFSIGGFVHIRPYSILFITGMLLGYWFVKLMYKYENKTEKELQALAVYIFAGVVIGARLGHCLFYDFNYYSSHPLEIFLPFKIQDGAFEITGYQGLASHGGALGVLIAIAIFCYKHKINYLSEVDKIAIVAPLTGAFIRLGNLMNSEIIGKPTDLPFAFVFARVDNLPRHPSQLYESLFYIVIFIILWTLYKKSGNKSAPGIYTGLSITLIFAARFIIEFSKEYQADFEQALPLDMGQILSIPFILAGLFLIIKKIKTKAYI